MRVTSDMVTIVVDPESARNQRCVSITATKIKRICCPKEAPEVSVPWRPRLGVTATRAVSVGRA